MEVRYEFVLCFAVTVAQRRALLKYSSWDEMCERDLPAMIGFVLSKTGLKKLSYVGVSQGTLIMFCALEDPRFAQMVI